MNRISSCRAAVCGGVVGVVCALASIATAGPPVVVAEGGRQVQLDVEAVREAPSGASFAVEGVEVPGWGPVDLELERFRVVSEMTRFVAGSAEGDRDIAFDPESIVLLRGRAAGLAGSHVVMAITPRGVTGRIELGPGRPTVGLASVVRGLGAAGGDGAVERVALRPWDAGPAPVLACGFQPDAEAIALDAGLAAAAGSGDARALAEPIRGLKRIRVAVDSDREYFELMGSEQAAVEYIVTVYGFVSDIMMRDINARIDLTWVRIWPGPDPDPYRGRGGFPVIPPGVVYDQAQNFAAERMSFAGGMATLCGRSSWIGHVLGFYGDPVETHVDNRDIIVAAHEMGHALGTWHTHDYGVDQCHLTHTTPTRNSIMSYCYYFNGGYANTDLRFHTVPQEKIAACHSYVGLAFDCNQNGIDDAQDIASGFSADVNGNGIPDECEDCNGNGIIDEYDIASGFSRDVNGNGIPDECEPDCNGNGIPDDADLRDSFQVFFADDFEKDLGWIPENLGAVGGHWERDVPIGGPGRAPTRDADGSGHCWLTENAPSPSGVREGAVRLTSPRLDLTAGEAFIEYAYYLNLGRISAEDGMIVEVSDDGGVTWFLMRVYRTSSSSWRTDTLAEAAIRHAGAAITDRMRIRFTVNDDEPYSPVEAAIDAVRVAKNIGPFSLDLNGNGIPDECEADLDDDGRSDYLQIQADMTLDINRNTVLDAYEDCDGDGVPDLVALDGAWACWAADGLDGAIRQFHPVTGVLMRESQAGLVERPQDLLITADRRIFVSDAAQHRIVEFNDRAELVGDLVAPGAGGLREPGAMLVMEGALLVASAGTDSVLRFDLETGAPLGELVASGAGGLTRPYGMTFGPRGDLYITSADDQVLQYSRSGVFRRIFVSRIDNGGLRSPRGILFTPAIEPPAPTPPAPPRFLVASELTKQILEFDPETGAFRRVFNIGTQDGKLQRTWGMALGRDGQVYVSSRRFLESHATDPRIFQYQTRTGLLLRPYIQNVDSRLPDPVGFAFMPGADIDCNWNQLPDSCDIASGFSEDRNGNGIPDECETCAADCDGDSALTFFDFLCFQAAFAAGEPRADCDGDGDLSFFDFLCFQNAYAGGCP